MDEDEELKLRKQRFLEGNEALALHNMQESLVVAGNTDNPLFLWKALSEYFDANLHRERLGLGRLEIPQQIRTYLAIVSKRLTNLSERLDYRQTPEPFGDLPHVQESLEIARRRKRTLDASKATNLALHAIGLRRDGWNAFERAMTLDEQDLDALTQEGYRTIVNMGEGESFDALLDDHAVSKASQRGDKSIQDARSLRKRVKASRDARRPR